MNKKENGFIIIENLISMSIIALISSLVVSIFSTSIFCLNKFKTKQQMINIAKSEMHKLYKYDMDKNKYDNIIKQIGGYEVQVKINLLTGYDDCYKFIVFVQSENDKVHLESYMVRN